MGAKEDKAHMRKIIGDRLSSVSSEEISRQSRAITQKVLSLPAYQEAKAIGIFLSMPNKEVETSEIVADALAKGKQVFVPYIHKSDQQSGKVIDMLQLRDQSDLASLQPDRWGIPSLSSNTISGRYNALGGTGVGRREAALESGRPKLDVLFMPAVAFDQLHNRLGHGMGFYDRYLARFEQNNQSQGNQRSMPQLIGLALKEQVLNQDERLPTTDEDRKVDVIVSP